MAMCCCSWRIPRSDSGYAGRYGLAETCEDSEMNLRTLSVAAAVIGVTVTAFAGSAIAASAGFADESWLMLAFAVGVLLLSQAPLLKLRHDVHDLKAQLKQSGAVQRAGVASMPRTGSANAET